MAVNKDSTSYIVIFSLVVCAICSLLLSWVNSSLQEKQEANAQNYIYFNVLKVVGLKVYVGDPEKGVKISAAEIQKLYNENIIEEVYDEKGNIVPEFEAKGKKEKASFVKMTKPMLKAKKYRSIFKLVDKDKNVLNYAIPISGTGLWGMMWGFLSFKADCKTVSGITFYSHVETPGLGAEVEKPWFQNQYNNPEKPIYLRNDKGELVDIMLIKGGVEAKYNDPSNPMRTHSVDGIAGATITSNSLNIFVNNDLKAYEKLYFKNKFQSLQLKKVEE